jgi:hypothetical protein
MTCKVVLYRPPRSSLTQSAIPTSEGPYVLGFRAAKRAP